MENELLKQHLDLVRERANRLAALEDMLWAIEKRRGTIGLRKRTLDHLRARLDEAHAEHARALLAKEQLSERVAELEKRLAQADAFTARLKENLDEERTKCQELEAQVDTLKASGAAEIRVLGNQLGQAAARERDLRAELEEKARVELSLRRKLTAADLTKEA